MLAWEPSASRSDAAGRRVDPENTSAAQRALEALMRDGAERLARRERLARARAALERELALTHLFTWDTAPVQATEIVSRPLLATVATAIDTGWTIVGLAGEGFLFVESSDGDAWDAPPLGWSCWDDLALELHARCPGVGPSWIEADLIAAVGAPDRGDGTAALRAEGVTIACDGRVAGFAAWVHPPAAGQGRTRLAPAQRRLLERLGRHVSERLGALHLRSEMLGFLFTTLKSLVAAVDAKDRYTRGHSERVHYLALRAGELLDLDPAALRDLNYAALLHDVGKIGIPRAILGKTSPLTAEEWDTVRRHPERGCRVVEPIPQLAGTIPAILHHHEHYDGSGYPDGLVGEAIPLLARIIAVADAFDAITSQRTYSLRRGCEEAVAILRAQAGQLFDPRAVEAVAQVVGQELSAGTLAFEAQREGLGEREEFGDREGLGDREENRPAA